ncbi:MAG: hypothetical protein ACKVW3_13055 [Phycisphaerales bacterium]
MSLRLIAPLAAAALCLCAGGCELLESRAVSPFSQRRVTASELAAEAARYDAEQQAKDLKERADAERELRRLRTTAAIEARKLAGTADSALADLQARTEASAQDVVEQLAAGRQSRDAEIDAMQRSIDEAIRGIEQQQRQRMAVWNLVQAIPGAQAVPGFGAVSGLMASLLAGGAVGAGAIQISKRGLRRRADQAETKLRETEVAAERVVDSIDVLAETAPEVKAAIKTHKALIDEWQGLAGKALVDRLQRGEVQRGAPSAA